MIRALFHWILTAAALLVISRYVQGFEVSNFVSALIAVVVIGLLNATVGLVLKILTLPLSILTLGLFSLVVNAVILWFAAKFVPGFQVHTFVAALIGAVALAFLNMLFHAIGGHKKKPA